MLELHRNVPVAQHTSQMRTVLWGFQTCNTEETARGTVFKFSECFFCEFFRIFTWGGGYLYGSRKKKKCTPKIHKKSIVFQQKKTDVQFQQWEWTHQLKSASLDIKWS